MPRLLLLVFLLLPLLELYCLIQLGQVIGAAWTIVFVIATAVLGIYVVRRQGFEATTRIQFSLAQGKIPAKDVLDGIVLLTSGGLLVLPGPLTDILGFLLLIPVVRQHVLQQLNKHTRFNVHQRQYRADEDDIIEGEIVEEPDSQRHLH